MRLKVETIGEGRLGASFVLADPRSGERLLPFGLSVRAAKALACDLAKAVEDHASAVDRNAAVRER